MLRGERRRVGGHRQRLLSLPSGARQVPIGSAGENLRYKPARPATADLGLKPTVPSADFAGVSVDNRLLEHWQRAQVARRSARAALPARWRNDPRPEMHQVVDVYVELLAAERQRNVVALALEDR